MTTANPAFAAFLEEQRMDYRRSLPPRLAQMQLLWQQVLDGQAADEALPMLERHAHSIAGSAATFGCAALGDAARAVELAIHPLLDAPNALTPQLKTELSRAIGQLPQSLPAETGT